MMRLLNVVAAVSIAVLSTGCVRTSHKLSEVGETVTDDEIVGVWEKHDPIFGVRESDRICIEARDDGRYEMRSIDPSKAGVTPFRLVNAADGVFMEYDLHEMLYEDAFKLKEKDLKATQSLMKEAGFLFPARWERRGEWMAQWDPDSAVVNRLIQEGKLKGHSNGNWPLEIVVTSTAEELETCLKEYGDEIYAAAVNDSRGHLRSVYRRVSTQVPAKPTELTTSP